MSLTASERIRIIAQIKRRLWDNPEHQEAALRLLDNAEILSFVLEGKRREDHKLAAIIKDSRPTKTKSVKSAPAKPAVAEPKPKPRLTMDEILAAIPANERSAW